MITLFKRTKELEGKIDEFLDVLMQAALEFRQAIKYYVEGNNTEFEKREHSVDELEGRADGLRREVENRLYAEMLLPEARGDVLALLENSDNVLNLIADTVVEFSIESPEIPEELNLQFIGLVDESIKAAEEMVSMIRSYFKNISSVRDHITKIMFHEKESDRIGETLKRSIFKRQELHLSHKIHITQFINYIQQIADEAEDVGDRVSIYTIKRMV